MRYKRYGLIIKDFIERKMQKANWYPYKKGNKIINNRRSRRKIKQEIIINNSDE